MTIVKEPLRCKLTIDNTTIDQIMYLEYLGCKITSTGFLEDEVRRQVNKAATVSVTQRKLRTTEMKTLRTIMGYTLNDRQRNTDIREKCETDDIVRWVRKRRREWNQHVNRMTTDRIAKIVRNNIPHGRRPVGRPPKQWRDSWQSTSQELLKKNRN
ncbi:uncharacterized protein LOC130902968 [Diorhabda carinulata]|uniref:uncharacterized protein LOC130902968 n=1 Tax=Diorhabda carinulata TaxID=1163345 RepID=UPI0025A30419|nr:uncharacterized protein LOC130902968 [Diorhabda carinulata]